MSERSQVIKDSLGEQKYKLIINSISLYIYLYITCQILLTQKIASFLYKNCDQGNKNITSVINHISFLNERFRKLHALAFGYILLNRLRVFNELEYYFSHSHFIRESVFFYSTVGEYLFTFQFLKRVPVFNTYSYFHIFSISRVAQYLIIFCSKLNVDLSRENFFNRLKMENISHSSSFKNAETDAK